MNAKAALFFLAAFLAVCKASSTDGKTNKGCPYGRAPCSSEGDHCSSIGNETHNKGLAQLLEGCRDIFVSHGTALAADVQYQEVVQNVNCAIGDVSALFDSIIAQLSSETDAGTKRAITRIARLTKIFVSTLTEQMANAEDEQTKWLIVDCIHEAVGIFSLAIAELSSARGDVRDDIVQVAREAVAFIRGRTARMLNEANRKAEWYTADIRNNAAALFCCSVKKADCAKDANLDDYNLDEVRDTAAIFRGLIDRMAKEEDTYLRAGNSGAIRKGAAIFSSAIVQLLNAAGADERSAILKVVGKAAVIVGDLADTIGREEGDLILRWNIADTIRATADLFIRTVELLPNAAADAERMQLIMEVAGKAEAAIGELARQIADETSASARAAIAIAIKKKAAALIKTL